MAFETTRLFDPTLESKARYLVHEGGSRSSKTWSILQSFVWRLYNPEYRHLTIDVVRKTMPSLRATALRDFFAILQESGFYNREWHDKTNEIYRVPPLDNEIAFYGLDQAQKIRGRKRDILFANEANELSEEDFRQLRLRTTRQLIFDYNPSDQFHWIYDKVLPKDNCERIHSTFEDNPFLDAEIRKEILALRDEDPEAWNVYGLGNHGVNQALIFPTFELVDKMPDEYRDRSYGLDVGWTSPSALIDVRYVESRPRNELYWDQVIYQRRLTDEALIEQMEDAGVDKDVPMYVDSAAAQTIENLYQAGFNAKPADKSVADGIKSVHSFKLNVTKRSVELAKELRGYRFKTDRDGHVLEDPVKFNDHGTDGGRYGTHSPGWVDVGESWLVWN